MERGRLGRRLRVGYQRKSRRLGDTTIAGKLMTYMLPGTLWVIDAVRGNLMTRPNSWLVISAARFSISAAMFSLGCLFIPMKCPCGKGPITPPSPRRGEGGIKEETSKRLTRWNNMVTSFLAGEQPCKFMPSLTNLLSRRDVRVGSKYGFFYFLTRS